MSRVILTASTAVVALAFSLFNHACAPSVPRSPYKGAAFDATADRVSMIPEMDSSSGDTTKRDLAVKDNASIDARARDVTVPESVVGDVTADVMSDILLDTISGFADTARPRDGMTADAGRDGAAGEGARDGDGGSIEVSGDAAIAQTPGAGDLRIDELLINPAGTDTSREWIEVANLSNVVLDLRLLHVADAAGEIAVDAGLLAPGRLLVLGQSLDPARNGGAPIAFSFGNTISLNNPGDVIRLCLGTCADGVVLDQVAWTSDLGPAFDGHAAIVGLGGDAAISGDAGIGGNAGIGGEATFCPAADSFGTAGSFGSPGRANPPCPG